MATLHPSVDAAIADIVPGFRALSISVQGSEIKDLGATEKMLEEACQHALEQDFPWAAVHLEEWAEAFRKFGAKPNRTPCSAAALRKRVFKAGTLGSIDPIVDRCTEADYA